MDEKTCRLVVIATVAVMTLWLVASREGVMKATVFTAGIVAMAIATGLMVTVL